MLNIFAKNHNSLRRPNLLISDPRGKLASHLSIPLQQRGYAIKYLNLLDLHKSIKYNPLSLIIHYAKVNDIDEANRNCLLLGEQLFYTRLGFVDDLWNTTASQLFTGVVFALLSYAHSRFYGLDHYKTYHGKIICEDGGGIYPKYGKYYIDDNNVLHSRNNAWNQVTISNVVSFVKSLGTSTVKSKPLSQYPIAHYFHYLAQNEHHLYKILHSSKSNLTDHMHTLLLQQYNLLAIATSYFKDFILLLSVSEYKHALNVFLNILNNYTQHNLAKMTSTSDLSLSSFCFQNILVIKLPSSCASMKVSARLFSKNRKSFDLCKEFFTTHVPNNGLVRIPIKPSLASHSIIYASFAMHSDKQCCTQYFNIIISHDHAKFDRDADTRHSSAKGLLYIRHKKPVALFCIIPPHRLSSNNLVSILVDQAYQYIDDCDKEGLHVQRDLDIILDDLGLLPAIDNLMDISDAHRLHIHYLVSCKSLKSLNTIYCSIDIDNILSGCSNGIICYGHDIHHQTLIHHDQDYYSSLNCILATDIPIFASFITLLQSSNPSNYYPLPVLLSKANFNHTSNIHKMNYYDYYTYIKNTRKLASKSINNSNSSSLVKQRAKLKIKHLETKIKTLTAKYIDK